MIGSHENLAATSTKQLAGNPRHLSDSIFTGSEYIAL